MSFTKLIEDLISSDLISEVTGIQWLHEKYPQYLLEHLTNIKLESKKVSF